LKLSVPL